MLKAGQRREHDPEKARKRLEELERQKGDRLERGAKQHQETERFGGGPARVGGGRATDR